VLNSLESKNGHFSNSNKAASNKDTVTVQASYHHSQMRDKWGGGSERKKVSVQVW
jgi:hypothetical protein